MNESPLGADWPSPGGQVERMDEALELIHRLWNGEQVDHDGKWFSTKSAVLHTLPEKQPPIYISAFGPKAAAVAGKHGDGLWTLADPEMALEQRELLEAIAALPDEFRQAVIAIDLVGLSYHEAGRLLGVREATITTRLYRARQRIA